MNEHSAKFYDKAYSEWGSVFRGGETTLNGGRDIQGYRPKQGGPEDVLYWLPLRKGIADVHRRGGGFPSGQRPAANGSGAGRRQPYGSRTDGGHPAAHSLERATRACAAPMGKRSSLASRREPGRFPAQRRAQPGFGGLAV